MPLPRWLALAAAAGCQPPTQIALELETDSCAELAVVGIRVASVGAVTTEVASTDRCAGETIGKLVATPSGDDDAQVLFEVLAELDGSTGCSIEAPGPKCIVARRILRYLPRTSLELPIALRRACAGVRCEATETCANGRCVGAEVSADQCLSASGCGDDVLAPFVPPLELDGWARLFGDTLDDELFAVGADGLGAVYAGGYLTLPPGTERSFFLGVADFDGTEVAGHFGAARPSTVRGIAGLPAGGAQFVYTAEFTPGEPAGVAGFVMGGNRADEIISADTSGAHAVAVSDDGQRLVTAGSFDEPTLVLGTTPLALFPPSSWFVAIGQPGTAPSYDYAASFAAGVENSDGVGIGFPRASVTAAPDGGAYLAADEMLAGGRDSELWRVTPMGETRSFGIGGASENFPTAVITDAQGNVYLAGAFTGALGFAAEQHQSHGGFDGYLVSFDDAGAHRFTQTVGGRGDDVIWALARAPGGGVFACGDFVETLAVGATTLVAAGGTDIFLARFDSAGQPVGAAAIGSAAEEHGYAMASAPNDRIYLAGSLGSGATLELFGQPLTSAGGLDGLLIAIDL